MCAQCLSGTYQCAAPEINKAPFDPEPSVKVYHMHSTGAYPCDWRPMRSKAMRLNRVRLSRGEAFKSVLGMQNQHWGGCTRDLMARNI
jgi:hypothetical protein